MEATIEQLETTVKQLEKREDELIAKYGPGTKYNRTIERGTLAWDENAKKYHVQIKCEDCGTPVKVFTSDLFQKGKCEEHAKEARNTKRKGKAKVTNLNLDLEVARAKLAELKARV